MSRCVKNFSQVCGLTIYEVPKIPMIFSNYRELPMPQDPMNIFLSGLLLIKVTDYSVKNLVYDLGKLKTQQLKFEEFKPMFSQIMEVGSVFRVLVD
ncbi:MAG: hypothetical protein JNM39_12480 [Bdellovibrionaceae bacterium]|nr:hypothetical protein [Pseudobdellovibrionaceae bacterium]